MLRLTTIFAFVIILRLLLNRFLYSLAWFIGDFNIGVNYDDDGGDSLLHVNRFLVMMVTVKWKTYRDFLF